MEDDYKQLDQIEHIHHRPDMYVGTTRPQKEKNVWDRFPKHRITGICVDCMKKPDTNNGNYNSTRLFSNRFYRTFPG